MQLTHDLIIPFLVIYPKRIRAMSHQRFAHPYSQQCYSQQLRWVQPRSLSKDEPTMNMNIMHTMEYYSAFTLKEILSQVITGMELEDIKLSEKAMHKKINTIFSHFQYLKQSNSQKIERLIPGAGERKGHLLFNRYRVSDFQDEKSFGALFHS